MRRVSLLAVLALLAVAATARADDRVIAPGVSAGGVDLGGLTVDAAAGKLASVLTPHLSRDIVIGAGGVSYRLTTTRAKLRFDALRTAQRAAHVKAPKVAAPAAPAAGGSAAGTVIPLALSHARLAVRAWVKGVAAKVYRAPRDATIHITVAHVSVRRATVGASLDQEATAAAIDAALDDGSASRVVHQKLVTVRPKVNANDIHARYGTIVTVDRSHFKLRLFKNLKLSKSYGVAVGRAGLDTPAGLYTIHDKQVNPAWHVPMSDWAGALAGKVIPGGAPDNPLVARWLGIADGIGIHGTNEPASVGSAASHGCIRMRPADVIDLFPRVPVGSTVLIK